MSHERHSKAKIAAELGVAGAGLAAAGAAGYLLYRKRRLQGQQELDEADIPQYRESLAIFDEPKVDNVLPNGRQVMAAAAVRIFYASHDSLAQATTRDELFSDLLRTDPHRAAVTPHKLQKALSYLKDHDLIGRRPLEDKERGSGYYARPALVWAMEDGDKPEPLMEAETAFLAEGLGQ